MLLAKTNKISTHTLIVKFDAINFVIQFHVMILFFLCYDLTFCKYLCVNHSSHQVINIPYTILYYMHKIKFILEKIHNLNYLAYVLDTK